MSLVNGDKSRSHRLRKKKIAMRLRNQQLREASAGASSNAAPKKKGK
jgi:hypothetical protein